MNDYNLEHSLFKIPCFLFDIFKTTLNLLTLPAKLCFVWFIIIKASLGIVALGSILLHFHFPHHLFITSFSQKNNKNKTVLAKPCVIALCAGK